MSDDDQFLVQDLDLTYHPRRASIEPFAVAPQAMSNRQLSERSLRQSLKTAEQANRALTAALESYAQRTRMCKEKISEAKLEKLSHAAAEQLAALEVATVELEHKLVEVDAALQTSTRTVTTLSETLSLAKFERNCSAILRSHERRELQVEQKTKCIVCQENSASMLIERHCQKEPGRPFCEKRVCECGAILCRDCMLHHYWVESNHGRKSFARCPHCRAEFCLLDITEVRWTRTVRGKISRPPQQQQQALMKPAEPHLDNPLTEAAAS